MCPQYLILVSFYADFANFAKLLLWSCSHKEAYGCLGFEPRLSTFSFTSSQYLLHFPGFIKFRLVFGACLTEKWRQVCVVQKRASPVLKCNTGQQLSVSGICTICQENNRTSWMCCFPLGSKFGAWCDDPCLSPVWTLLTPLWGLCACLSFLRMSGLEKLVGSAHSVFRCGCSKAHWGTVISKTIKLYIKFKRKLTVENIKR